MRVVYLHQYFITPEMAGGSRSFEMARRLVDAGHEVHMVTSDQASDSKITGWRESIEAGIHVHWIAIPYNNSMGYGKRILAFFKFAWHAARMARRLQGDIVFATSTPLTIAIPAVYASRRCKIPMVFEVRDLWPAVPIAIGAIKNPLVIRAARWLERFAYRNATRVVALAPGMRDEVIATGYPADKVAVIPNGCDLNVFSGNNEAGKLREKNDWLGERPLIVFTGTFGLVNGMEYLVYLAKAIERVDPEIRIAAVGAGREFQQTRALAIKEGVLGKNLFLLGQMPKVDTAGWVMASDMTLALFTGPEIVWRDAVQNKFFDSLAAGKPVLNNFPGWQSKMAERAGAGLIISATDFDAAAGDITSALGNSEWMEKAGLAASKLGRERFDRDLLAADLDRVLGEAREEAR